MDCLDSFKRKLNEMLSLLPGMSHSDQLAAMALWEKSISSVQDGFLLNKQASSPTEQNLFGMEFVGGEGLITTSVTPFEEPCDVDEERTDTDVQAGIPTTSVETLPVESMEVVDNVTDDQDVDGTNTSQYEDCVEEQGEDTQQTLDKTPEEVSTEEDQITEGDDTTQALLKEVVSGSKDIWTLSGETDHNVVTTESAVEEEAVVGEVAVENGGGGSRAKKTRRTRRKKEKKPVVKETKEDKCTCGVCGKALANPSNLRVHLRVHNGVRPYKCSICDKSFSIRPNMRRHEKTHSGEKPWECTQCLKRFTEKKSLKVHFRSHTGEKPFECKQCGKCFTQAGTLQSHMHVHTGWKGHLCDFCGKSFRQKSQLRLHEFRHTNNRRYVCQVCTRSFISKGELDRHSMQHTGERPYLCTLCPKMFTRLTYLKEHMNSHTEQTPFLCPHCSESFQERAVFTKHVKRHQAARNTNRNQQQVELHTISAGSEFGSKDPYLLYIGSSQVLGMLSSHLTTDGAQSGDAVISVPVLTVKDSNFGDAQQMAAAMAADSLESVLDTSERFVFVKAEEKVGQEEGAEQFAMVELLETAS